MLALPPFTKRMLTHPIFQGLPFLLLAIILGVGLIQCLYPLLYLRFWARWGSWGSQSIFRQKASSKISLLLENSQEFEKLYRRDLLWTRINGGMTLLFVVVAAAFILIANS